MLELAIPQLRGAEERFQLSVPEQLGTRADDLQALVRGMYVRGLSSRAQFIDELSRRRISVAQMTSRNWRTETDRE